MKAIINGLRYDTETATLVGEARAGCPASDFGYWEAGLYRTPRSGRYFVAGHGGPMTQFGRPAPGGGRGGGERVTPMTKDEAFAWAQEYLNDDEIEAAFADAIKDA